MLQNFWGKNSSKMLSKNHLINFLIPSSRHLCVKTLGQSTFVERLNLSRNLKNSYNFSFSDLSKPGDLLVNFIYSAKSDFIQVMQWTVFYRFLAFCHHHVELYFAVLINFVWLR